MANPLKKVSGFFLDARQELKKVTWPTREELRDSTAVVVVSILLLGAYIGVVDFVLSKVVEIVIR